MIFLRRPVTRTQRRGTEPARSDSFSYNGRNELTGAALGAAPYGYSYDNIGNRKTAREPAQELVRERAGQEHLVAKYLDNCCS